ncbi:1-acyl-sn-glycerol-3-phosphate acyltransferase gamma [Melipona quadrifasciata]|uniref:1-acyl-sn-glycerol-3-phosphate acyltransferase gamma n=1 Tax=Melipona quadrifasciata TaxID=166423 RepID=A0A0M9A2L1_9HYME|nr:1-acyl-sn-glycerol-3-phosphate acyltransferase gamma [Melipona quadrifasciata]
MPWAPTHVRETCKFVFVAEWWSGLELVLYMNKDDLEKFKKDHKYVIMNHRYEIDWICGWILCERTGVLGNCKAYVKKSLQYVPTFGWAWRFAEFIFMERNWEKDKEIITSLINELVNYPDSITLLLCAEGTRVTAQKLEASQKFAQKAGLPVLNYHLTPRTKGFIASLPHMRGKITDIYDMQLQFKSDDPIKPTLTNLLQGKQVTAHLSISRIPLNEVPEDEKGAEEWLHKLYEKKDRMAKSFEETGDFFAISGVPKLERNSDNRSIRGNIKHIRGTNNRNSWNSGNSHNRKSDFDNGDMNNEDTRFNNNNNNNNDQQDCIMQCFFNELDAVDQKGFPEKNLVVSLMVQNIQDPELKDFFVESITECFRYLESNKREKCEFSQNLLICLGEKEQQKCEDWEN